MTTYGNSQIEGGGDINWFESFKIKTKSFTLIELLIVIVIIGILAVSLLPRLIGAQDRARVTSIKALLNQAYTQAQLYHMDSGGTYAGLCNDPIIQGIISSLGGSGYASCYVHPNTITTIDWGIATKHKAKYYFTEPQGVMVLDEANIAGPGQSWNSLIAVCESQDKKLPGASAIRAIWGVTMGADYPSYLGPGSTLFSFTEDPVNSANAWGVNLGNGSMWGYSKSNNGIGRCASMS